MAKSTKPVPQESGATQTEKLIVEGGTPLKGVIRVGGAKNASYKLMIASILGSKQSRLLNLPGISDVDLVAGIINDLGGKAYRAGHKTMFLEPQEMKHFKIDPDHGEASRASTLFVGPLLARFWQAEVPLPGGDRIGKRPLGRHLEGLEQMGVKWKIEDEMLKLRATRLRGTTYRFNKNTHTGTETLIMAAVMADGKTILENAAQEPEVDDLISFLNQMGARIRRRAFRVIEIEGVKELGGAIHKVMPDRNEAVSYACGAIATKGDIIIENANHEDLTAFIEKVEEAGGGVEIGNYGVRFFYQDELRATDITTEIHPGFMTDWQPLWATLITQAKGKSVIHETVMQNRFQYADLLRQMGAEIKEVKPEVKHPYKVYNFDWKDRKDTDIRAIEINGPTKFKGTELDVPDLRAGATALLAAISGQGTTTLTNIEQIDRGYEDIEQKLRSLGAKIKRVNQKDSQDEVQEKTQENRQAKTKGDK
ncbi:MAG: UDP-N-acetylglucosamine 1-carboxyvinyltransferase [Candidatus Pacebacteria bacterium]|nr:UDP-N-acetylglucosamine 1-carboxyvinyltransferase [Candidatus Paceibacterota bacterium]